MPDWTPNQKLAIVTLDRSVSISAGAGSGKTAVLVERFCHIVESGAAAVDEILTVTFTEKAAREMKERIVRRFRELGRESDRRAVETAYIGTIHGFCNRLLRENAFEAGVDPRFIVLSDAEQGSVEHRVLDALIESALENPDKASLIREFGPDSIKSAIHSVFGHASSLGWSPPRIPIADAEAPWPFWESFRAHVDQLINWDGKLTDSAAGMVGDLSAGLSGAISAAERLSDGDGPFDWDEFQLLKEYRAGFRANVGTTEFKSLVVSARDELDRFLSSVLDRPSTERSRILRDLLSDFQAEYTKAKAQHGLLDYDDLLLRTRYLLLGTDGTPTETALRYRGKFRFINLDESQDTNRLQKQIVDAVSHPDTVFTVGDVKQSIFSFIHSDVDVFRRHLQQAKERGGLVLPLQENFRSRPGVIDFANRLFAGIWAEEPEFEFEELKCAADFASKDRPDVDIVLVPKSMDDSSGLERGRRSEARAIAQHILEMTGRTGDVPLLRTKGRDAGHPVRLGDIMVLLRSTTELYIYERTLEEYGIDTYVVSGRGFYGTHEVQDVVSLLRTLDNPLNDIAMAAVLRSPFVGVTEDTLFYLTRDWTLEPGRYGFPTVSSRPGKLWRSLSSLDRVSGLSEEDRRRLSEFVTLFTDLLAIRSQPKITDILDQAIERSGFDIRLLAMRAGKRKYANVRKLMEVAYDFQSTNLFGLSDFITHVQELERLAEREVEAPTEEEGGDVVRIMTIHKAKGLQAPVVFVADLSRKLGGKHSSLFAFDRDLGLAAQVRNPLTYDLETPLCHRGVTERLKTRGISEEKRLFYVAATRAEEHLALVGCSDLKGDHKSTYLETPTWSGWIEKALGLDSATPEGDLGEGNGFRVTFSKSTPETDPPAAPRDELPLSRRFSHEILAGKPILSQDMQIDDVGAARLVARCSAQPSIERIPLRGISVSQVLDYLDCPAMYYYTAIVGMAEDTRVDGGRLLAVAGPRAADVGNAVHEVLDRLDFRAEPPGQLDDLIAGIEDDTLRAPARPLVESFINSKWFPIIRSSHQILREVPFRISITEKVLTGRADILFRTPEGWTVLDYKTGEGESERYDLQVGIYAHAASRLLGEMPVRTGLLFLRPGEQSDRVDNTSDGRLARQALDTITSVIQGIESANFIPSPGKHCQWCPRTTDCPRRAVSPVP